MPDQRLRPTERLHRPREYQRVFQHGMKLVAAAFVLYVLSDVTSSSRLGMAVSKRVGKAVVRNRVKRRLREIFRRCKEQLDPPCDVVIVARRQAAMVSLEDLRRQFVTLLRRYQHVENDGRLAMQQHPSG